MWGRTICDALNALTSLGCIGLFTWVWINRAKWEDGFTHRHEVGQSNSISTMKAKDKRTESGHANY